MKKFAIPEPTRKLILCLAEVGHLYKRIDAFIRAREGKPSIGMIEQSLCHHLQSQLTEYYRLIAILESQMSITKGTDLSPENRDIELKHEETGLTLKRLNVWIQDWRLRMRMMSVCVEGAKGDCLVIDRLWVANIHYQMPRVEPLSTLFVATPTTVIHSFASLQISC